MDKKDKQMVEQLCNAIGNCVNCEYMQYINCQERLLKEFQDAMSIYTLSKEEIDRLEYYCFTRNEFLDIYEDAKEMSDDENFMDIHEYLDLFLSDMDDIDEFDEE